jgi:hypothetical protein
MAELTLQNVFGANATQTATTITISKADLTGLVATSNNNPDQIGVAILNKWTTVYATTVRDANKSVSITTTLGAIPGTSGDFTVTPNVAYMVYSYTVNVYIPLPASTPSPNDV